MTVPGDRIRVFTATTGTGSSVVLGAAVTSMHMSDTESGLVNGQAYDYSLEQGSGDFEQQVNQVYTLSTNTIARGTPTKSRVGGSFGTTKITLDGTAQVIFPFTKTVYDGIFTDPHTWTKPQAFTAGALTSGAGADFTANALWTADVNGSTFTISNPATAPVDKTTTLILIKFTTAHSVSFGSKFKVTGYLPSMTGRDALMFCYDSTADQYWMIGARLGIDQ